MCILSIFIKNKLVKESTVKYFFINYDAKAIEYQRTDVKKYMYFKDIDVEFEYGICHIIVSK